MESILRPSTLHQTLSIDPLHIDLAGPASAIVLPREPDATATICHSLELVLRPLSPTDWKPACGPAFGHDPRGREPLKVDVRLTPPAIDPCDECSAVSVWDNVSVQRSK